MPTYEHKCEKCNHEWDDFYGMNDSVPDTCPSCGKKGGVKRLISAVAGRVAVQGRRETREHLQKQANEAKKKARTDENYLANALGEDKYHQSKLADKEVRENIKNL